MENKIIQSKINKSNRKILYDVLLIMGILAAALAGYVLITFFGSSGQTVVISQDNTVLAEKPINVNDIFEISGENGYNRVVIDNGEVYMENADCPDKICVKTGHISKAGETIVCLPHKVVIEIKGKNAVDSIAQ